MNIVAIILARGGSKGIPKKNIINFCGKPLVSWSIKQAKNAKNISSIWVSSDNKGILNIAKKEKVEVIKRPKSISTDKSSSESGWIHAIKEIEKKQKVDLVIALQATSPLRESKDLDTAIKKFKRINADSMFSCSKLNDFFLWKKQNNRYSSLNYDYKNRRRRQEIKEQYLENGSFYIFKPEIIKKLNNRLGGKIDVTELEFWKSFEIDSFESLRFCETLMKKYLLK
ncbi:MAG: acylneuraminate cytidylyltransferase family protein [Nitrosopumilus sp.]|nr:acylneuraminate cytidylyltransferase family protein [Nitrosopumilus sp.]